MYLLWCPETQGFDGNGGAFPDSLFIYSLMTMLLYLSSFMLGSDFPTFAERVGAGSRVAIIANALDQYSTEARSFRVSAEIKKLSEFDLDAHEFDLRPFFDRKHAIQSALDEFDLLWVYGGNSFVLKRAFEQSGLDDYLPDLLSSGALTYAGFSAALVPVMTTLTGLELCDDPTVLPAGYRPEFSDHGLGLVDRVVVPHFRSDHRESSAIENYVRFLDANTIPYVALRDGQALLVDGDSVSVVGSPEFR